MAPIITLVRAPELFDNVLQYLSDTEVLNLAFTCKALGPLCSRYLWATLRVTKSLYSSSGRAISSKLNVERVVEEHWSQSEWIRYTRYVVFGRALTGDRRKSQALIELLESGKLRPNRVDLEISHKGWNSQNCPDSLLSLKKYSQSRSPQEFSILLESNVVHSLPALIDLAKVAKLTLGLLVAPRRDAPPAQGVEDLTMVLMESPNLTYLSWEGGTARTQRFHLPMVWDSLQNLQAAVAKLRHLKVLKIHRYLFHPSFFLTPPESVKTLSLECIVSEAWWRTFSASPLPGLENLTIGYVAKCDLPSGLQGFVDQAIVKFDTLTLGNVAVRDLKKFSCNRNHTNIPLDLRECIARNNVGLDIESRKELKRGDAEKLLAECYRSLLKATKEVENKTLEFMAEYARMLVQLVELGGVQGLEAYIHGKDQAKDIGGEIERAPATPIPSINTQLFTRGVIEKARNFVVPIVYEFTGTIKRMRGRVAGDLARKLAQGIEVETGTAMEMWVGEALICIQNVRRGIYDTA
ncbi:hypothetical protein TWF281_005800 [Arthrobotrys megalospora]